MNQYGISGRRKSHWDPGVLDVCGGMGWDGRAGTSPVGVWPDPHREWKPDSTSQEVRMCEGKKGKGWAYRQKLFSEKDSERPGVQAQWHLLK